VHILVAVGLYVLALQEPDEDWDPGNGFEVSLSGIKAGQPDGKAEQAPDGASHTDTSADRQTPVPQTQADSPPPAEAVPPAQPPVPPQPPTFSSMPMPTTPPPVPDTADAWAPRVQAAPRPPSPPPAPPAPPPQPVAAAPRVMPRPSLQRSVDIRNIPGRSPTYDAARGSPTGSFEEDGYGKAVFGAIDRVRFYPPRARDRGDEGSVLLRVVIGDGGTLVDAYIVRGSGFPELDAACIDMAHRASFPPLPRVLKPPRTFDVPIEFGIRYPR